MAAFAQSEAKNAFKPYFSRLFGGLRSIQQISCGFLWLWMKLGFTIWFFLSTW